MGVPLQISGRPELLNRQILGSQMANCHYIYCPSCVPGPWVRICDKSGGGTAPVMPGGKQGLLGASGKCKTCKHKVKGYNVSGMDLFSSANGAAQRLKMGLLGETLETINQNIASCQQEVTYYTNYLQQHPGNAFGQERLGYWKTQLAFWVAMSQKTIEEQVSIGTGQGFQAAFNAFQSSMNTTYQKVLDTVNPNTVTKQIAGFPIWGWVLLAGAGVYVVYDMKKKK